MIPNQKIDRLIKELRTTASEDLDRRVNSLCTQTRSLDTQKQKVWSIIMHSKLTKQIAAAIIIAAGLLSLTVFDKTVAPAYAIEQTLQAIAKLETVHMLCKDWDNNEFEMWVRLNRKTGIPDYCRAYWPSQGILDVSRPDRSYQYDERSNYVQVNSGKLYHINMAPIRMFERMVELSRMENSPVKITMQDEINPETGKSWIAVVIENPGHICKVFIDPTTKLPVRMIGVSNNRLGEFIKDIDFIEYNIELPEGVFDFKIPEGARVSDHDEFYKYLRSPKYGIRTDGLIEHEAAEQILSFYWNALKANDQAGMFQVFPSQQPKMVDSSLVEELVNVGEPYIQNGCGIGKIAPCRVRLTDGRLMEFHPIIKFRNINGESSCIIAGQYGGATLIEE